MTQYESMQKLSKTNLDAAVRAASAVSKGVQAAAVETVDYTKRSFELGSAALERLLGARSLDKAIEVQTDFVKTSYESLVAQATKMGTLATTTAREAYAPIETIVSGSTTSA